MKKIAMGKIIGIALISLLFAGCVSTSSPSTTQAPITTSTPTTTPSPAQFEIAELRVSPETPKTGDTLSILADVRNTGDTSGSYTVLVTVGETSKTKNIELDGKSSKTVVFQFDIASEGNIEIKAGNITKTIVVQPPETQPPTTQPPTTTPAPTTAKPTAIPKEKDNIEEPDLPVESVLTYYFTVEGNEWGTTVYKTKQSEEKRSSWFVWGNILCALPPNGDEDELGHQDDYTFSYNGNALKEIHAGQEGVGWCCIDYTIDYTYSPALPSVYPLVKGISREKAGSFYTEFTCKKQDPNVYTHAAYITTKISGRGTYKREIYVEDFEEIEAGGETYKCAKVKFTMTYEVNYNTGETWKIYKWVEDGYAWYGDIGMVKADYTVKTYFSDELEHKDRVSIILNSATLP